MTDIRTLGKYVELAKDKKGLEDQLTAVKAKMKDLEPGVLSYFERQGLERTTIDGTTLYVRRELWAGKADGVSDEDAAAALEAIGLGSMVKAKFNTSTLSAHFREIDATLPPGHEPDDCLPPELRGVIKLSETFKLGFRNS